ncbi:hypothetical protein LUZ61_019930 [Rhynchospora tenuis]|uniref:F-box domain-containing protein n=1 Tax=Rhynchospora tenuis TaxID=198213 RepID=A0AAD6ENK9_9POAL|nr:hypothetical protein LUZ61_019930 [Rhynchospora tenuis]
MAAADRISELHDSILTHILSYLPTKEAVRTQILSKRWRNVWASVPVLDINFADFWYDYINSCLTYTTFVSGYSEFHEKFVKFVDTVLASRQVQQVDRFKQVNFNHHHHLPVRRWIHHVVQQLPRVLSIYLRPRLDWVDIIPDPIFTCSSLEEIKLQVKNRAGHSIWLDRLNPMVVTLPHLRRLNLGHFKIEADFMDKLLLGCPILEEVELCACWLDMSQISCDNLMSLIINGCYHSTAIEVSIPSLQYLKVTVMSSQPEGFVFKNMSSLVKASICLLDVYDLDAVIFDSEAKILAGLLGVTTLDIVLCGLGAEGMLEHILETCPHFENLKFMNFESFDGCCINVVDRLVDRLVQHSPALKEVTVYGCQGIVAEEIVFLEELIKLLGEYDILLLVERHQGSTYGSLSELKEFSHEHMNLVELIGWAAADEEDGEENEGGVWWEDEEGDEGEASSVEEEGEDEADEYEGGAMEEGEEMVEELDDE